MMASPKELDAFALGLSLSEVISPRRQIFMVSISCPSWSISAGRAFQPPFYSVKAQRRALAGCTGCGICGVEQLDEIGKPAAVIAIHVVLALGTAELPEVHLIDRLKGLQPIPYLGSLRMGT
ncbi:hypothetical protein [Sodalis-like endosymbiont of Proechinophthirus fluctus]|uniref:hypothetical protein n=1 Tax=Sodalis-like endosymbiont of Proechinophthirus fluctus TaxID=1462730 RepID=UPI001FCC6D06|nr:hypothetical protein [Sodalis-like endosymbiont of Proechinophthirus fluctus]